MILHGDCVEKMREMEDASVDAVVTDPPYSLGFMGKAWDKNLNHGPWATEAFRVLKPGGYLLAFGGTRTVHRLASAIEDAGFEIRDELVWLYSQGFPKGMRPVPQMWDNVLTCQSSANAPLAVQTSRSIRVPSDGAREPTALALARILPEGVPALLMETGRADGSSEVTAMLLSETQAEAAATAWSMTSSWKESSGVRYDEVSTSTTEITRRLITDPTISSSLIGVLTTELTPTAPSSVILPNGWPWPAVGVVRPSPDSGEKLPDIPVLTTLGSATWNPCVKWAGHNVALKPAHEPIVMARKPLVGTVAGNVAKYGTGAINIGATRIGTPDGHGGGRYGSSGFVSGYQRADQAKGDSATSEGSDGLGAEVVGAAGVGPADSERTDGGPASGFVASGVGRWPSNILLTDPELFDEPNPYVVGSGATPHNQDPATRANKRHGSYFGGVDEFENPGGYGDSGGYSRFFIIPKADRADREPTLRGQLEVKEQASTWGDVGPVEGNPRKPDNGHVTKRGNTHPTVKPTDLMRHLVRLVTPPGGLVLDPFLGSGTTGIACEMEGFRWVGIEKEAEYVAIAEARLNGVQRGLGLDVGAPVKPPPKTHPDLSKHQPKRRAPSENYTGGWMGTEEDPAT